MHIETPKERKKRLIRERNKRHNLINIMARQHENSIEERELSSAGYDREKLRDEEKRKKKEEQVVWSAKVNEVRNRLTGKREQAQERWNRFAGTSGGGGRGL